jgi:hypothetical protein
MREEKLNQAYHLIKLVIDSKILITTDNFKFKNNTSNYSSYNSALKELGNEVNDYNVMKDYFLKALEKLDDN